MHTNPKHTPGPWKIVPAMLEELDYDSTTGVRGPVAELRHRLKLLADPLPLNLGNKVAALGGYLDDLCSDARAIAAEIDEAADE